MWVPNAASEALRDLVRQREAAKQDQLRARHRLTKLLLRTGQRPPLGLKPWTEHYWRWLGQVRYAQPAREVTRLDCINEVEHMSARVRGHPRSGEAGAAGHAGTDPRAAGPARYSAYLGSYDGRRVGECAEADGL